MIPVDGNGKRAAVGENRTPKSTEVLVDLTSDSEDEMPLKRKVPQSKRSPAAQITASDLSVKGDDSYNSNSGYYLYFYAWALLSLAPKAKISQCPRNNSFRLGHLRP